MSYWFILIPLIGAFIGWISIWATLKLLFRPYQPKHILGVEIQGVYPKHQQQLAEKLGKIVSKELLSFNAIEDKISNPENLKKIMPVIENHIDDFLRNRLGQEMPAISMFIGDKTIAKLKSAFMTEIETLLPKVMHQYATNLKEDLDIGQIVTQKITSLSPPKLEGILTQHMGKELRKAPLLGACIGFIIGLVQVLIMYVTS